MVVNEALHGLQSLQWLVCLLAEGARKMNQNSLDNLTSKKLCPECKGERGNRIGCRSGGTICGLPFQEKNLDGTPVLDAQGNTVMKTCTYVFYSKTQAGLKRKAREAVEEQPVRLPAHQEQMKMAHVEASFNKLMKKVFFSWELSM